MGISGSDPYLIQEIPGFTPQIGRLVGMMEYVVVHEMLHLIEPTHSERFVALLDEHYPAWREARAELNELCRSLDYTTMGEMQMLAQAELARRADAFLQHPGSDSALLTAV